jgi:hypothetical protein
VNGILYGQDGSVLFQAETSAWSLDTMDTAVLTLARALAFRQPVPASPLPYAPSVAPVASLEPIPPPQARPDPNATVHDHGPKVGIAVPRASGKSFSPSILIEFDGRYGPRDYFLEFGAGLLIPTDDNYNSSDTIRVTSGFLEIGGSYYLWASNSAVYLGGGLSPAFWTLETRNSTDHTSVTCGLYGQAGITFTRDSRVKLYAEFRLTQLVLAVANSLPGSYYGDPELGDTYHPMVLAFHGGVAW